MSNQKSGIMCAECETDLGEFPDHMCGYDPIVLANETTLIPFPEYKSGFRCKSCWSGVGRQHYECKLWKTKVRWLKNRLASMFS